MKRITRRRLLGSAAAASLPVALPAAAEGMSDLAIVRMLIDAHKAAVGRWDNDVPEEIWPDDTAMMYALSDEMDKTAAVLCLYRSTSLEGVHAKAEYMLTTRFFMDIENEGFFTLADLISGFLPAGKDVKPWADEEA
ncbi:hypothetical protein [Rhizobium mongolense]|uniref:Secreted protein n=1 Tax=Rhizobium mongolense TaxID=57676 RepID=A0A7W6WBV5_9HYPH|nr:hypothetical protein [Rhizobium mongolense]MBB4272346.1 hypothetical protein [Rhizobium mongolense]